LCDSRKPTAGWARASRITASVTWAASVASPRRNFSRAGTLASRSRTTTWVPGGAPAAPVATIAPLSTVTATAASTPRGRVVSTSRDTDAIEGKASPRKPIVAIVVRSSTARSFDVAWRVKASRASSGSMPMPSSTTRIERRPPPSTSIAIWVASASRAFSTSSFTTDAGRSTTSPAAI
jgi:hypothetical protein